jgi:hypothetical protein
MVVRKDRCQRNENAVTGLELVILMVAGILLIGYIGYGVLSHDRITAQGIMQKQKQGMIPNTIVATSNLITDPGGMFGFPAVDGTKNGVLVRFSSQDPHALGAFQLTIQPFMMTTGAIDMGHASVFWVSGADTEKLSLVQTPVLVCPNWTITKKGNFIPLKSADQDLFLEDTEQFTLLICPAGHAAPYQQFTLTITPENGEILSLTRRVPFDITPLTALG